jgi:molecular chaperone Hsp31 and glyoxalase 3
MPSLLRRLLGIAPTPEPDGPGLIPSRLGLRFGVEKTTNYAPVRFDHPNTGPDKVLVLCTEERYFEMANGALFSTGHNVTETAVPLLHLQNAGFDFDVVTPTGAPAVLEDWSSPVDDTTVMAFVADHRDRFQNPASLADLVADGLTDDSPYVALFLPGGHGAMVGLPDDENVGRLLRWVAETDRHLVAVCHGPAAMLATRLGDDRPHPYAGYELCAFPDSIDRRSPSLGYLPGPMPWFQVEELEREGLRVINDGATGATHTDRRLHTGDSPRACDELGRIAAEALLAEHSGHEGRTGSRAAGS